MRSSTAIAELDMRNPRFLELMSEVFGCRPAAIRTLSASNTLSPA